jgi:hypothetical protein
MRLRAQRVVRRADDSPSSAWTTPVGCAGREPTLRRLRG